MNVGDQPLPVLPLQYAAPGASSTARDALIARICLWTAGSACAVGWGLIFVETETVIGSGAALAAAGAGLFAVSVRLRCRLTMILGLAHCGLCALFVGLVNGLGWGPGPSTVPFLVMGGIYNVAVNIPFTALAHGRLRGMSQQLPSAERVAEGTP
jgi:hypothetical protein